MKLRMRSSVITLASALMLLGVFLYAEDDQNGQRNYRRTHSEFHDRSPLSSTRNFYLDEVQPFICGWSHELPNSMYHGKADLPAANPGSES